MIFSIGFLIKAVSVSAYCEEDPWEKYYLRMEDVDNKIIPVGCVLTMVGTGSEMNGGSVITNHETRSNIMWTATWALNTLVAKGKSTDLSFILLMVVGDALLKRIFRNGLKKQFLRNIR